MRKTLTYACLKVFFAVALLTGSLNGEQIWGCEGPPEDHFWVEAEYLYWKIQDSPKPIDLVTSGSDTVLGGSKIHNPWRSGGRFGIGGWFCEDRSVGLEANYLFLAKKTNKQTVASDGNGFPAMRIPFFDVITPGETSTGLSSIGNFTGIATLEVSNRMQGAEFNGIMPLCMPSCWDITLLGGFRYWNFTERLEFATSSPFIGTTDVYETKDVFQAQNNFYGGQAGLSMSYLWNCFSFELCGKVALGSMHEEVKIHGSLSTNDFTGFTTIQDFSGGYFALPTNIGRHKKTEFSVIPEVDFKIVYDWSQCLTFQLGYTFLYVSDMLYATKTLDHNINPSQSVGISNNPAATLVGEASPKARLKSSSLWAQGLTAGLMFSF